jgi:hypothetical protein
VTTIPEPTGHCTYRMCVTFHFCAAVPLGRLLRSKSRGAEGNHEHDFEPSRHRIVEVAGVKAVVTMIPKLMGLRTYVMFRFCATIPPLLSPTLTNVRDLSPLVTAWVWPTRGAGMKRFAQ